jgi:TRAP transporter TAXI family solute receptor
MTRWKLADWLGWLAILCIGVAIIYWGHLKNSQPQTLRIATASKGGYYHQFGLTLKQQIEKHTAYKVEILATEGSVDNRSRLLSGNADLAIVQGSIPLDNLSMVAPLWEDLVHVVVRADASIQHMTDLRSHAIAIGKPGSGYRTNAIRLLEHYSIRPDELRNTEAYFAKLIEDPNLDGAIVTTGLLNPDFSSLMATGAFRLIPIPIGDGFSLHNSAYHSNVIPQGVYPSVKGPLPEAAIPTISTYALLMTHPKASYDIIKAVMPVLYSVEMRDNAPLIANRSQQTNASLSPLALHPAAKDFVDPYAGISVISDGLTFLAQFKEILGLGLAALLLIIYQWKQRGRRAANDANQTATRELEKLLMDLSRIEGVQRDAKDMRVLRQYLDELTAIKAKGFELAITHHIQNSMMFLAFMQQSIHVINQVNERMLSAQDNHKITRAIA